MNSTPNSERWRPGRSPNGERLADLVALAAEFESAPYPDALNRFYARQAGRVDLVVDSGSVPSSAETEVVEEVMVETNAARGKDAAGAPCDTSSGRSPRKDIDPAGAVVGSMSAQGEDAILPVPPLHLGMCERNVVGGSESVNTDDTNRNTFVRAARGAS